MATVDLHNKLVTLFPSCVNELKRIKIRELAEKLNYTRQHVYMAVRTGFLTAELAKTIVRESERPVKMEDLAKFL